MKNDGNNMDLEYIHKKQYQRIWSLNETTEFKVTAFFATVFEFINSKTLREQLDDTRL